MAVYISSVPPANPQDGDFWVNQQTVPYQLLVWRVDTTTNTGKWLYVISVNTFTEVTDITTLQPVDGEIYIDTTNNKVYIGIGGQLQEINSGA